MKHIFYVLFFTSYLGFSQEDFVKAETFFQQEEFGKASTLFQKYLADHPTDKKTREYLGDIAGYNKDWDTAIGYYQELVEEESNNANYNFKYGGAMGMKALEISRLLALTYIGDIRNAFEKAAILDPNHIEVRWALVEFYMQLPGILGGSETKSMEYANQLGKISPVDGYLANGYIAEYSGRPKDAEGYYKNAIKVGGSYHTYEKLSNLYEKNNQPKEAIETSTQSLKIHKRNQLNYQIGKIAAQYDIDPQVGIRCLMVYIENHSIKDGVPKDWAYYRLAQIYKNEGDKELALSWVNRALEQRPDFKEAISEKGVINSM